MKKTFTISVILIFAMTVLLYGCGEQAGEAYYRFSGRNIQPAYQTPVKSSQCTYRESTPVCDKDTVVTRIQNTDCTTDEKRKDCSAYRLICKDGDCTTPCRAMRSDRYCDGDVVKYDYTDYRCNTREGIVYMNCASSGKMCRDGACTEPTPTCPTRSFSRCEGDDAVNISVATDCTETEIHRETCDYGCTEVVTDVAVCNGATEEPSGESGCCIGTVGCAQAFYASECSSMSTFYPGECEGQGACAVVACCHGVSTLPNAVYNVTCAGTSATESYWLSGYVSNPSTLEYRADELCGICLYHEMTYCVGDVAYLVINETDCTSSETNETCTSGCAEILPGQFGCV